MCPLGLTSEVSQLRVANLPSLRGEWMVRHKGAAEHLADCNSPADQNKNKKHCKPSYELSLNNNNKKTCHLSYPERCEMCLLHFTHHPESAVGEQQQQRCLPRESLGDQTSTMLKMKISCRVFSLLQLKLPAWHFGDCGS